MEKDFVKNPFIVGKYVSDKYFCDRSEETAFLRKQIENGRNVALISPRRIGKSGLIHHLFNQPDIKERYHVFFIDIYATTSLSELVYVMGKEIYEQLKPKTTAWKEQFFRTIASLRIGAKIDPASGMPTLDLGLGDIQTPQTTLDEIFDYLNQADKPCIVAIDEFQQIGEYAENNVEALLRTKIQLCQKAQFIFAGSKRHVMSLMFNSPAKPFYQSSVSMGLDPIPVSVYTDFATHLFAENNRQIDSEVVETVWQQYEGHTWFVQMMMNELYAITPAGNICRAEQVPVAMHNIIMAQEANYKELLSNLPPRQKTVLQAIAKEGTAHNITSQKFVKKYNLGSASSVQSAVRLLLKSELITQQEGAWRLYDFFFSQWIATVY